MNQAGTLIGIILAAVVAAAALIAPQVFPDRPAAEAAATRKAALATRQLYRYVQNSESLKRTGGLDDLRSADLSALVKRSDGGEAAPKTAFDLLSEQFAEIERALRSADQRRAARGGPQTSLRPPTLDPSGVQASVGQALAAIEANQKLLAAAESNARDAARDGRGVLGASLPLGMVLLVKASEAFDTAAALRRDVAERRYALLARVLAAKLAGVEMQGAAEMAPEKAVADLRSELEKVAARQTETEAEMARLGAEVADREAKLATVRELLASNRKRLLDLESAGFKAGSDAAFESFRATYCTISEELATLQQQEEQWLSGGRKGGTFAGDDPFDGEIEGGEPIVGLEEMQRRLALARETAARLSDGAAAIQARIEMLQNSGADAAARKQRAAAAQAAQRSAIDKLLAEIQEKITAANTQESAALEAAQGSASAFADARSAASQWKSDASRLRGEADPNGQNARLKIIQNDRFAELDAVAGEIAAKLLAARVHALRVAETDAHLKALDELRTALGGEITDRADIERYIEEARTNGDARLKECADLCATLAAAGTVDWIGQGLLAATRFVHARVDAAGADNHRQAALTALDAAAKGRERSPYLAEFLLFRDRLKAALGSGN